jgi:heptosyltransferase-2
MPGGVVVKQAEASAIKSILIRGTNWVGDSVICIPAMMEIRRLFPAARISLLVRPWVRDIYAAVDFADEVLEYDKDGVHSGFAGFRRLISDLRNRKFEMAILLQNAFEAAWISWAAGIPNRIGYARDGRSLLLTKAIAIDPEVRAVHQAYYYLGILSGMGLLEKKLWRGRNQLPSARISVRDTDRAAARDIVRSGGIGEEEILVGINPGAFYGEAKRWFADRYAAVADALADEYKARILLFGAQSDLPVVQEVAAHMKHSSLVLAGRTTLGQLMALIRECRLLITNDSGPMHLAAALDVPQVAIFGSTSEIATGPLNSNARVVKHPVDCNPCFRRECPTDFRCMKGISIAEVLEAGRQILQEQGRGRT